MLLSFNYDGITFLELTYISRDPVEMDYHLFTYDESITGYSYLYIYNVTTSKIVSINSYLMLNSSVIKLKLDTSSHKFWSNYGTKHLIICSNYSGCNFDFVDKAGSVGTVYVYNNLVITNNSGMLTAKDIYVASINLEAAFIKNSYPFKYKHIKYTNGYPSQNISITQTPVVNSDILAMFNNVYKGVSNSNGYISGFNSLKEGMLELFFVGNLEFSDGSWNRVIHINELGPKQNVTITVRCGKSITTLYKALNSIKAFYTEVA